MVTKVLSVSASLPNCTGGIQRDLQLFQTCDVFGFTVITELITIDRSTQSSYTFDSSLVKQQFSTVLIAEPIDAINIGCLTTVKTTDTLTELLLETQTKHIISAPVNYNYSSSTDLTAYELMQYAEKLIPLSTISILTYEDALNILKVSPNVNHDSNDLTLIAKEIFKIYRPKAILILKIENKSTIAVSQHVLFDGKKCQFFTHKIFNQQNKHSMQGDLAAFITAELGKGLSIMQACKLAEKFIEQSYD
ncbi:bifunctional hydroxymethylpyrimidine kinase/phosphomethylpyrimidine kinase [Vagococcus vulneris]|nr:bifunctional hydroxymethylpyrimidine kinase/phosphomethylpyrimidine kinase [Vagococcus vulneris]